MGCLTCGQPTEARNLCHNHYQQARRRGDIPPRRTGLDEVAVELAIDGVRIELSTAERHAAIAALHSRRWSDGRIAHQIGSAARTVFRIRKQLNLPAWTRDEQVTW